MLKTNSNNDLLKSIDDLNRKTKILIIEDDPISCKLLENTLKKEDYMIFTAQKGFEGLNKAKEEIPDIVLLDIMLPDVNGFEICNKIREDNKLENVAIIIITSLHDRESHKKGIELGADDFLTKPFDSEELKLRVKAIAKLNRFRKIITERKKFEWVVERSEDGYVIIDKNDNIVYLNSQARLFLNLPQDQSDKIEKKFKDIVLEQYNLEPKEFWVDWVNCKNDEITRFFVRPESPFINALWLQIEILNIPESEKNEKIIRMKDVTNQKYSQARMRSFQSMVYHKLRTPMTSVLGGMEIVSQYDKIDLSQNELREYFDEVSNGLRRLYDTIEDIFAHQEAMSLNSYKDRFDLSNIINLINITTESLNIKPVEFNNQIKKKILLPISERAFEYILYELLENSKKFHPKNDPEVSIEIKISNSNEFIFLVTDNGKHIPPENINKVWAPYYQVEKIFTGNIPGIGLGLSSVATIVWSAGGKCSIYNRKDKPGVVVEIILPIKE